MPVKPERVYRYGVQLRAKPDADFVVEGYATTFNEPYVMYEYDGVTYRECISRNAFDGTDMSDVIMQYDHCGRVYARQSNGTLTLIVDEHGLFVRADLSKTEGARQLYEDIASGMITKMSFAFTIAEQAYSKDEHLVTIARIKKVYDVSAVSIPANPSTDISARSYFEGVIEKEKQELLAAERQKQKIRILLEVM